MSRSPRFEKSITHIPGIKFQFTGAFLRFNELFQFHYFPLEINHCILFLKKAIILPSKY